MNIDVMHIHNYIRTRIHKTKFVQTFQCFFAPQQLLRKVMASLPAKPFQTRRASRQGAAIESSPILCVDLGEGLVEVLVVSHKWSM